MDDYVTQINYRGISLPVYKSSDKYYTILAGQKILVCESTKDYSDAIKEIIDRQLGEICRISDDCWLEWFNNAGYDDIRLKFKSRVVKVWLVNDKYKVDLKKISSAATEIYKKLSVILLK